MLILELLGFFILDYEAGILWNDKKLGVKWGIKGSEIFTSLKDEQLPLLSKLKSSF